MACEALIEEFTTWLDNPTEPLPTGTRRVVQFTIATNQRSDQTWPYLVTNNGLDAQFIAANVVAYGLGNLIGVRPFARRGFGVPVDRLTQLRGTGQFWFSDRADERWGRFGRETDVFDVRIEWPGRAILNLRRWGNAEVAFDLQCVNDVMFGFGPSIGNQSRLALYSITLSKHHIPV